MKHLFKFIIPILGIVLVIFSIRTISVTAHPDNIPTIQNGGWYHSANLPTAIGSLDGDSIGDKIYVAGGQNYNGTLDTLFSYDPISNTWHILASLPSARAVTGIIAEGGKLYMAGGWAHEGPIVFGDVYAYNPGLDSWVKLADMPALRMGGGLASWQGKLYYVGGRDENDVIQDTVYEYNINTNTWTLLTTLPEARYDAGAVVVNGVLYVVGGWAPSMVSSDIVGAYDLSQNSWSIKSPIPVAKGGLSGATKSYNGKIYVVGGRSSEWDFQTDVEVYDALTDTWQLLLDLPTARTGLAAALIGENLFAIGGRDFYDVFLQDNLTLQVITAPADVTISGANFGSVGESYNFTATVEPISTTLPLTYLWQVQVHIPITNTSGLTDTVSLTFNTPGTQTITVTASNIGGSVTDTHVITISPPIYNTYLPLIIKSSSGILTSTLPSSRLGDGEWIGLVIVGIVGMWKRNE